MIPVILKGDTSAKISLNVADGWDYTGVALDVEFCGVVMTFVEPAAGSVIEVSYTAGESARFPLGTHKVIMTLRGEGGERSTLPWGKIKVTDAPAEVYDAQITVDPGVIAVEDATAADSLGDVKEKLNAVLEYLRGTAVTACAAIAFALPCFGAGVHTAALNDIPGNAQVVTNVAFDGLVSMSDLAAATNAIPTRAEYNALADRGEKIEVATNTTAWAYDITGTVTGKKYDISDGVAGHIHLLWRESVMGETGWTYDQGFKIASTDPNADAVQYTVDAAFWTDAAHTNAYYEVVRVVATRRVSGKPYIMKTLATVNDLAAVESKIVTAPAVTNIARAVVEGEISPDNAAFSNAVLGVGIGVDTNAVAAINALLDGEGNALPVGGAATVGGLLAALAAALAALKKRVMEKYPFVAATIAGNTLTLTPYSRNALTSDGTAFTVLMGGGTTNYLRDCVFVVTAGSTAPTISWGAEFHPRTDAATDFACVAGAVNVYWITEYAEGEFAVAGWQVTEGGNA